MNKIEMTVQTIAQYKVLQFINDNFFPDNIQVQVYDKDSLIVADDEGGELVFRWNGTEVVTNK